MLQNKFNVCEHLRVLMREAGVYVCSFVHVTVYVAVHCAHTHEHVCVCVF